MDIALFSKCLKDLILKHDEVIIPGLGTFTAQTMPASVAEDGTATPPYRKVAYSPSDDNDDGTFLRFLAKYLPEGSDVPTELQDFILDLTGDLDQTRSVILEGIGELKATPRKTFYFTGNTDIFVYPDVPGQESVSDLLPEDLAEEESKPIELSGDRWAKAEEGSEEASTAQPKSQKKTGAGHKAQAEPKEKQEPQQADLQEENPKAKPEPAEETPDEPESPRNVLIGNILLIIFVLLIFAMIAVTLFKDMPWMSNLLDHLLYTKEELEILGK